MGREKLGKSNQECHPEIGWKQLSYLAGIVPEVGQKIPRRNWEEISPLNWNWELPKWKAEKAKCRAADGTWLSPQAAWQPAGQVLENVWLSSQMEVKSKVDSQGRKLHSAGERPIIGIIGEGKRESTNPAMVFWTGAFQAPVFIGCDRLLSTALTVWSVVLANYYVKESILKTAWSDY